MRWCVVGCADHLRQEGGERDVQNLMEHGRGEHEVGCSVPGLSKMMEGLSFSN